MQFEYEFKASGTGQLAHSPALVLKCPAIFKRPLYLNKIFLVMKLAVLLLFIMTLQAAAGAYAQKVTLHKKDATLLEVLKSVRQQTGYLFVCDREMLKNADKVSIDVRNAPLESVLKACFENQPLTYLIVDKTIIVQARPERRAPRYGGTALPLPVADTVRGTVTDSSGYPLPGVSIQIEGTALGTQTNVEGHYEIAAERGQVLLFSFIGLQSVRRTINASGVIDVVMQVDTRTLDEVVVTAFGISREKKALTYSVQEIDGDALSAVGNSNLLNGLQGKVSGVTVQLSSGMPGKAPRINIRGSRSITGNNEPLYVIDGMPVEGGDRVVDINPNDIASMSVLKGPAASALYGLRASNGVIVITTKNGKQADRPVVTFNTHYSIDRVARLPELQKRYSQGFEGEFDLSQIWTWGARIDEIGTYINEFGEEEVAAAYDNDKAFYDLGGTSTNNISLANSGNVGNYLVGVGYTNQTGIIPGSGMERYNIKFSGESTKIDKLTVGISLNYSDLDVDDYPEARGNDNYFRGLVDVPPSYNLAGKPYADPSNPFKQIYYRAGQNNPYWTIQNNFRESRTHRTFGNLSLKYDITKGLAAMYRVGMDYFSTNRTDFRELGTAQRGRTDPPSGGSLSLNNTFQNQVYSNFFLNLDRDLGQDFNLNVVAGNEFYDIRTSNNLSTGSDFVTGNWVSLANATNISSSNSRSKQRTVAFYGNLSLGWKNMLFLNASGRNDIVSNMPSNNRSFFYSSVGTSFTFTEAFPQLRNVLSLGKLRATYAEVGQVGPIYVNGDGFVKENPGGFIFPFNGITGLTQRSTRVNPSLEPENTKTLEMGIDLQFINNRLGLNYTYYSNRSEGQIYSVPIPYSTGASTEIRNAGVMLSKGHEITLVTTPVRSDNFEWELITNFNTFENTVEELAEGIDRLVLWDPIVAEAGYTYPSIFGRSYLRDPASGQIVIDNDESSSTYGLPLLDNNLRVLGSPIPDFELNFINSFRYKRLSVSMQLDWRKGGVFWNHSLAEANWRGLSIETLDREQDVVLEGKKGHWNGEDLVIEGDNDIVIKKQWPYYSQLWTNLESQLSDASFVRLREVTVTYSFPERWFTTGLFKSASLYFTGRNLFLISDAFTDPEINSSETGNDNAIGVEYSEAPQTKSFGLGLKATF